MNSRDLTTVLLVVLALLVGLPLLGMSMMGPGMMGWRTAPQGGWGWSGAFGLVVPLLLLGGIILVVLTLRRGVASEDPAALLKLRLARGEITREQFEELRPAVQ
jgi:uncharacterized membrane protein